MPIELKIALTALMLIPVFLLEFQLTGGIFSGENIIQTALIVLPTIAALSFIAFIWRL